MRLSLSLKKKIIIKKKEEEEGVTANEWYFLSRFRGWYSMID
jgi:hypothetical protein